MASLRFKTGGIFVAEDLKVIMRVNFTATNWLLGVLRQLFLLLGGRGLMDSALFHDSFRDHDFSILFIFFKRSFVLVGLLTLLVLNYLLELLQIEFLLRELLWPSGLANQKFNRPVIFDIYSIGLLVCLL